MCRARSLLVGVPLVLALASPTAFGAKGWDQRADNLRLGVDAALVIPTGDWSNGSGIGLGALLRFEALLAPTVAFTARIGYIGHFEKNGISTSEVPILWPGVKLYVGDLYFGIEAGLINLTASATGETQFGTITVSASELKFGTTLGVGYEVGDVDLRLQLFAPSVEDFGDFLAVMFTIGYAFAYF